MACDATPGVPTGLIAVSISHTGRIVTLGGHNRGIRSLRRGTSMGRNTSTPVRTCNGMINRSDVGHFSGPGHTRGSHHHSGHHPRGGGWHCRRVFSVINSGRLNFL